MSFEDFKKPNNYEIVEIDGKKYERIPTGYTIKEYFSHETIEKGPGPGWDYRWSMLPKIGVDPAFPQTYPDEPYFKLKEIKE